MTREADGTISRDQVPGLRLAGESRTRHTMQAIALDTGSLDEKKTTIQGVVVTLVCIVLLAYVLPVVGFALDFL